MVSVTTWLIVINAAVFACTHLLLPQAQVDIGAGRFVNPVAKKEQIDRAVVETSISVPVPGMPWYFYHPIIDPESFATDAQGQTLFDLRTGRKIPLVIGQDRFTRMQVLKAFGHFSTGKAFLEGQVWRFITFQFLHADIVHLLFNMMGLWFVGGLVEEYLGRRRFLAFYLAAGLFGAIAYLALNFLGFLVLTFVMPGGWKGAIPALLFDDIYTPLIGASAGVFGVLMAAAKIAPDEIVDVLKIIPMKMRTAVYIFLALAVLNLLRGGDNAGGDAAHVGGAIAGAILIRRAHLLRDFFDVFSDSRKRSPMLREETVVDNIVQKVKQEGLESLTDREREIIRKARAAAME